MRGKISWFRQFLYTRATKFYSPAGQMSDLKLLCCVLTEGQEAAGTGFCRRSIIIIIIITLDHDAAHFHSFAPNVKLKGC